MALKDLTRDSVFKALAEHDASGAAAFRDKYGIDPSWKYALVHDGKSYDSKAIAGAAHGYVGSGRQPLTADDFSGGKDHAVKYLRRLGFEVPDAPRNGPWSRDELILALDLYMTSPTSPPGKTSAAVTNLSKLLDELGTLTGATKTSTYRNPNGVYLKMMNFRAIDPAFTSQGKVGMSSLGRFEQEVWREFAGRREALRTAADAVQKIVSTPTLATLAKAEADYDDYEVQEGGVLLGLHKRYERDRKMAERKRRAVAKASGGKLSCEVCNFDFAAHYGPHGEGFIEVHHRKPVHAIMPGEITKLSDLAALCANCHRMAHRRGALLSIEELRVLVKASDVTKLGA